MGCFLEYKPLLVRRAEIQMSTSGSERAPAANASIECGEIRMGAHEPTPLRRRRAFPFRQQAPGAAGGADATVAAALSAARWHLLNRGLREARASLRSCASPDAAGDMKMLVRLFELRCDKALADVLRAVSARRSGPRP